MYQAIEERRGGLPLNDVERIARHYELAQDDACALLEVYSVEDLLPERGSGLPTNFNMSGHTIDDLKYGLDAALSGGQSADVAIASTDLPTDAEIGDFFVGATSMGYRLSYPQTEILKGIPVTSFNVRYEGSPPGTTGQAALALITVIPTALIVGIIAFGITKISDISKALVPLLLITGGIVVISLGLLSRKHVVETAGKFTQRRLAKTQMKYLTSTDKNDKVTQPREWQFPKEKYPRPEKVGPEHLPDTRKRTRDMVEVFAWQERDRANVEIRDKETHETVAEWWDNDLRQMFEDGFFKGGLPSRSWEKPSRNLIESVLDYAESVGLLITESKWAYRLAKGYSLPPEYLHLLEPESFPKRKKALEGLTGPIEIAEVHDDGDLTVTDANGALYVVTTEGEVFLHHTAKNTLEKVLGDQYLIITDPGKSTFNKGETISLWSFYRENQRLKQRGEAQASGSYEIKGKKPGEANGHKNLLEFLGDSPEFLAYTVDMTGCRQKLDNTFQSAIVRARGNGNRD